MMVQQNKNVQLITKRKLYIYSNARNSNKLVDSILFFHIKIFHENSLAMQLAITNFLLQFLKIIQGFLFNIYMKQNLFHLELRQYYFVRTSRKLPFLIHEHFHSCIVSKLFHHNLLTLFGQLYPCESIFIN